MNKGPENPVTTEELAAAMPSILSAPRDAGIVRMICTRPKPNTRNFPEVITLTRLKGVSNDYHPDQPWLELDDGSADSRIEVSILPWRVLDLCWRERDRVMHPGDNIAVDMLLSETDLPTGTLLSVGTAVVEVSDVPNDGCVKWKVRCGRDAYKWIITPENLKLRLRGLYARIVQDGEVRVGDVLRKV